MERKARIKRLDIAPGRRIIVISDIHGNLPYLKALLEKIGFCANDELIVDGDYLEKGQYSLETLRFLMELSKKGNTHVICGNCDDWSGIYDYELGSEHDEHVFRYMMYKKCGLLWDMCNASDIDPFELESFSQCKEELARAFKKEWEFLAATPHVIETENFTFAHAGRTPGKALEQHTAHELNRCDGLLNRGWSYDKWLIVGHWPVMLYGGDTVCANPIIDREKKIVSIDGGCVLKDDGQLNALIIPHRDSEDFTFEAYDPFPERIALDEQAEGGRSYYIRWGDSRVQVLERGEEFSHCRHERTGYEMDILTKYLFTDNEFTDCNDCTDYVLPVRPGDILRLVETSSRGYFVKRNGVSGWYFGELE